MVGRVGLIKSIINVLTLFYLSFFKAPSTVCTLVRRLQIKLYRVGVMREGKLFRWPGIKYTPMLNLVGWTSKMWADSIQLC